MNVRLLRRIQKHILAVPKRFVMGTYILRKEDDGSKVVEFEGVDGQDTWQFPKCQTAACIAGWAVLLSTDKKYVSTESIRRDAVKLLEVQHRGYRLFSVGCWPEEFRDAFSSGRTPRQRAKVAAARIDHFIKTKGKE